MNLENPILRTEDLKIGYRNRKKVQPIASDLNLDLKAGKVTCLLGQNGIGKSTLLRTLSRMQPELEGKIWFDDIEISSMNRNELATKIGLVLTERIPNSNLTVYELVALGRQPYTNWLGRMNQADRLAVQNALVQSQLEDLALKRCDELSDGQLQRAMICRAVAQDTSLILLDEPTAHLDVQHKIETFQLLQRLSRELHRSVLISTHEIQLAIESADELWLMNDGGVISGNPEELINSGQIDLLFDRKRIRFDKEKRRFKMI